MKTTKMMKLNLIKQDWINKFNKPLIISGPCSAESKDQVLEIAKKLKKINNIKIFRAGIWKPRTRPNSFEGIGEIGLKWLKEVKKETGLLIATEIANATHVKLARKHEVDILWIGARSTVNPFTVQEIAEALKDTNKIILVKNPINPDIELWIGALERLLNQGITKLGIIHRGFSTYKSLIYRNPPNWDLALKFKKLFPNIPILCDPSHICGNKERLLEVMIQAINFNYDGFIIETHCNPDDAFSDSQQQIQPSILGDYIKKLNNHSLRLKETQDKDKEKSQFELDQVRNLIKELDHNIIYLLSKRVNYSEQIALIKKNSNLVILQQKRWKTLIEEYKKMGTQFGLATKFLEELFKVIHKESRKIQKKIINL
ncbi:MAG: chorismate mutase [Candidatus Karelsulcia muelleri]